MFSKPVTLVLTSLDRICKPEVEIVPQTGSTNILATETDIDAISKAIPMFFLEGGGRFFNGLYANLTRRLLHAEVQDGGRIPEVFIIW